MKVRGVLTFCGTSGNLKDQKISGGKKKGLLRNEWAHFTGNNLETEGHCCRQKNEGLLLLWWARSREEKRSCRCSKMPQTSSNWTKSCGYWGFNCQTSLKSASATPQFSHSHEHTHTHTHKTLRFNVQRLQNKHFCSGERISSPISTKLAGDKPKDFHKHTCKLTY